VLEDKLNQEQRIRLEALAQTINSSAGRWAPTKEVLKRAQAFEYFILLGQTDVSD
jgi:hypothetical protein